MPDHRSLREALPEEIEEFALENRIGEGAVGQVFAATHKQTGKRVAIKLLAPEVGLDTEFVARFQREARLAAKVRHPNLVAIHQTGNINGLHYIIMDFVDGEDLLDLTGTRPLPLTRCFNISLQAALGLKALHAAEILHRDIKPQNILVDSAGHVTIIDLGIARDVSEQGRLTLQGVGVGSLAYASPEQIVGKCSKLSDIYSLGCTFFHMLTGRAPFNPSDTPDMLQKQHDGEIPSVVKLNKDVPVSFSKLVRKMMAPKKTDRIQTIDEVIGSLETLIRKMLPQADWPVGL